MQESKASAEGGARCNYPWFHCRDIVVFPHTMVPFVVGRKSSLLAVERSPWPTASESFLVHPTECHGRRPAA